MTERADVFCGCAYVRTVKNGLWYQVVACPDHLLDTQPCQDPPKPKVRQQ